MVLGPRFEETSPRVPSLLLSSSPSSPVVIVIVILIFISVSVMTIIIVVSISIINIIRIIISRPSHASWPHRELH